MSWELDEACMRAMGWEYRPRFPGDTAGYWRSPDGETVVSEERPLFSTSPADAVMLEDEIERRGLWWQYTDALMCILFGAKEFWRCIRATPEQRARAFLEAMKDADTTAHA